MHAKYFCALQSVLCVFVSHLPALSQKIPTFLHFWRATLELWPHLDGEHLWSANDYPISAKRGCSCSPRGALFHAPTPPAPLHRPPQNNPSILQTALVSPGSHIWSWGVSWRCGSTLKGRRWGVTGINGVLLVDKAQTKRAFSGWDRRASPHTPGWPGES